MSENGSNGLGVAVETALRRMKTVWRVQQWTPDLIEEYRRVLVRVGDAGVVDQVADTMIGESTERFAPPPGAFAKLGRELTESRRPDTSSRGRTSRSIDEDALRDAVAALGYATDDQERAWIEEQIKAIRSRMPNRGADVDLADAKELRFVEAVPDHRDPPGTVRFVVIQPDEERRPKGARVAGE